ncbi:o-succinylbenzoate synthase [Metabacillus malikii]|uniref:o-succinylbenzoate synthase n=1 Tax=Metabacillus malikii TaxID=1504265 RepID=A0ABT9ZGT7_9BACI|nr:o-succinylbenzoate synthase [Metabacillus malikii]MDQ0231109.1 O-succinylbenzoate synthase [Metabacillus malikii]
MIKIKQVTLHHIVQSLKTPFHSSSGYVQQRESILVEVLDEQGVTGWGEVVAFSTPWYTEETISTAFQLLKDLFIPLLLQHTYKHPDELEHVFSPFKRNFMAKASIQSALWDIYAQKQNQSLSAVLGGVRKEIASGVVIGLASKSEMMTQIQQYVDEGYQRFKVKISPQQDIELIEEIRKSFPDIPLMADANSAYELNDIDRLKQLDKYKLMMIEQPLAADDIIDHAKLQHQLDTPICLDESIVTCEDARKAIELGSCRVINIKPGRVGGLTASKKIHDLCEKNNIPVWCGGMIETGISRAHNIAIATLPNFTIPGDISSSSKYWEEDIVEPEITAVNGTIKVPTNPGLGYIVRKDLIEKYRLSKTVYTD